MPAGRQQGRLREQQRDDDLWDEVWDSYDAARAAQARSRRRRGWFTPTCIILPGVVLLMTAGVVPAPTGRPGFGDPLG